MKAGMAYVALSRVHSLNDLMLIDGFNLNCIRANLKVEAMYRKMGHCPPT